MDGAIWWFGGGWADAADPQHILPGAQVGSVHGVYMNKADMVDDKELLELVEMEVRELLHHLQVPWARNRSSSARPLKALEGDKGELGVPSVVKPGGGDGPYIRSRRRESGQAGF